MNLLQAVLAAALVATLMVGGIQYIDPSASKRSRLTALAESGFTVLDSAFRARQAAGLPPPAPETWEAALFPAFADKPAVPAGFAWSYGMAAEGAWFCLSGTGGDPLMRKALETLQRRFPPALYTVADGCAGRRGAQDGALAATYWVVKAGG